MTIQGIRAVAIYVGAVTVQIANLISFEFSKTPFSLGEGSPTGGRLDQADSSVCRFSFIDSDGSIIQQLESWKEARTRVSFVAAGVSTCVQWYERDTFRVTRKASTGKVGGRSDVYDFEITREGHGRHAIYQQTNLLAHLGWTNEGGIAKGYTATGAGTLSWLNPNTQQIDHDAPDAGIYADIVFPLQLPGFTFSMTSDIVNLHSEVGKAKLQIIGYDFAGTQILVDNLEFDSTGRKTVKFSTSSSIALHRIRVLPLLTPSGITVSDLVGAKEPVLRMDAGTDYIQN